MAAVFTLAGRLILEKFDGVTALGACIFKYCIRPPVAHILTGTFHDYLHSLFKEFSSSLFYKTSLILLKAEVKG
jgi:hypothetical protein